MSCSLNWVPKRSLNSLTISDRGGEEFALSAAAGAAGAGVAQRFRIAAVVEFDFLGFVAVDHVALEVDFVGEVFVFARAAVG